jgi:hypothetical protein
VLLDYVSCPTRSTNFEAYHLAKNPQLDPGTLTLEDRIQPQVEELERFKGAPFLSSLSLFFLSTAGQWACDSVHSLFLSLVFTGRHF